MSERNRLGILLDVNNPVGENGHTMIKTEKNILKENYSKNKFPK